MSEYQKQKVKVKCLNCLKTRVISLGQLQRKTLKNDLRCRGCLKMGIKMSTQAKIKMSISKKKLVLSGWLPDYAKKYKGGHSSLPKICNFCLKEFYSPYSTTKSCSKECSNRKRVSDGTHHFWKGGVTPLNFVIRSMVEYERWKQEVIGKHGFVCEECHVASIYGHFILMHVDHIVPLSFIIKKYQIKNKEDARNCVELWDINNGRILCKPCHEKTDTYMSKANNYEQLTKTI